MNLHNFIILILEHEVQRQGRICLSEIANLLNQPLIKLFLLFALFAFAAIATKGYSKSSKIMYEYE
ncbi:hypothetical protein AYI92_06655 [Shewanella xiamenensis]|nr:hypothetical protein AYI90_07040 [Shewanella xiamenensis]TVL21340.1 hypothetical protein AYI91_07830 [Shewanella xiamenensis]TVL27374.1 hypothetical protein AYI92_06655 [Shewanella xiamenensis]TVL34921.1 hypothetical protein AYI93_07270 [Shewanella xiamenensis]TVL35951.1 hypothetical protein AYI95_00300 [Shewanella xiamenensis]